MSLRPLIEIAAENERVHALTGDVRDAAAGGEKLEVPASAMLRPLLLAAMLEDDRGLAGRPALLVSADDRSARDLAADLRAYLAPRRVRLYPSRGTGFASHVTPPPHLIGLRIDALDALGSEEDAVVVAGATALAEAVPDAALRPAGFAISEGEEIDLASVARDLAAAGYERVEQVTERGQFAVRGGILDVFGATEERAVRIELFGDEVESMRWFSTFTQRSLGDAERVEMAPAAELDAEHRELAELAAMEAAEAEKEPPSLAARPFRAATRPGSRLGRCDPCRRRRDRAGAARSLGGRDDGDACRRRPPPLCRCRGSACQARRPLLPGGRRRR
jgi:transcription-repair coupling factor (superfamily II helicase)